MMDVRVSQYIVNAEVWEKSLYTPPNPIVSQFIVMAEVKEVIEEEKSFNIYLGTTPIKKIYLGSTEITNAIY